MNTIPEIIEDLRQGKMVIMVDDEERENEGDLILAADWVTPEAINFMVKEARGLVCLALAPEQIQRLGLPMMVKDERNLSPNRTAFTVSIEAARGISTGISAADRAHTVRVAVSPSVQSADIITPGHVFPIRAQPGGVLQRAGHTEASVDLSVLAGRIPGAVICEIMNDDGTMARVPELTRFAEKFDIRIGTIVDLIRYRIQNETFVEETASTAYSGPGEFTLKVFTNKLDGSEHIALIKGKIDPAQPIPVRVQTELPLEDVFYPLLSTEPTSLRLALKVFEKYNRGVLVYLRKQTPPSFLAGSLSGQFIDRPPLMDDREYGVGAQILRALGLHRIVLVSNHPTKRVGLKGYGLEVEDMIPLTPP